MKKILLLIPLQLSLIFPNLLITQINYNYSKNNITTSKTSESYISDTAEDQVMFNWEETEKNKTSYGYYTADDLIKEVDIQTKPIKINNESYNITYDLKIGITNKTSTYYSNNSYNSRDYYNDYNNFEKNNFSREIKTIKNYYGIGAELKITNINDANKNKLDEYSLYIGQTYNDSKNKKNEIGNYQKAKTNYDAGKHEYYFYYDNWSGMIQDETYLNFMCVNKDANYSKTSKPKKYDYEKLIFLQDPIEANDIYSKTNLNKDEVNTYNNSFGINYDEISYEKKGVNSYNANFSLKWNSPYYFWSQYFHYPQLKWINKEMYFSAIYKVPINSSSITDVLLFSTNNFFDSFSPKKWSNTSNIKNAERSIDINYNLYNNNSYYTDDTDTYILGYYNNEKFIPINDYDSTLIELDNNKVQSHSFAEPEEIHFFLSFLDQNNYSPSWNDIFIYNESANNQAISYKLVDNNKNNIFEYNDDILSHSYTPLYNDATGYQNAFLIPEWDNVYHEAPKASFFYMNFIWFVTSLFICFLMIIFIFISFISKRKRNKKEGEESYEQES